tara:strand:+ start:1363 stop:2034 length:672 start_codon:yes stop_codon:yes gene_type:complete
MSTTVIIPTKNEVIGVEKILPQVKKEWADEWIVMDGNSKDGTVDAAKKLNFNVIQQTGKGAGNAYREGVKHAHSENVLFFSPDGNCKPEYIPKLIKKLEEGNYDVVQISRFGKSGSSDDDSLLTAFGNQMFTFLVNIFFGGHLTDALYGYKIVKKKVFEDLDLDADFLTLEQQISIRTSKFSLKIAEIGGNEPARIGGERKMIPHIVGSQLSKQIIKEFIFWK